MGKQKRDRHRRILETFESVRSMRGGPPKGASDAEIDRFGAEQNVAVVPVAVREVMRLIGADPGPWFVGSDFGIRMISAGTKWQAVATVEELITTCGTRRGCWS
ncbi:hypothetical protein [Nocardia sp. IFM 10818]